MPPATDPVPLRILENLETALALPDGGANYYHAVKVAGWGRDITAPAIQGYPAVFIGEPGEIGQHTETAENRRVLFHGSWYWDVPIFGVIQDVGMGKDAYRELMRLAADIYRAVMVDHQRGGLAVLTAPQGWTILGPKDETQGRPWVAVLVRIFFRTKDTEMVTPT